MTFHCPLSKWKYFPRNNEASCIINFPLPINTLTFHLSSSICSDCSFQMANLMNGLKPCGITHRVIIQRPKANFMFLMESEIWTNSYPASLIYHLKQNEIINSTHALGLCLICLCILFDFHNHKNILFLFNNFWLRGQGKNEPVISQNITEVAHKPMNHIIKPSLHYFLHYYVLCHFKICNIKEVKCVVNAF